MVNEVFLNVSSSIFKHRTFLDFIAKQTYRILTYVHHQRRFINSSMPASNHQIYHLNELVHDLGNHNRIAF